MQGERHSIINIFCYKLPASLARPIHNEFDCRYEEIKRIWDSPKYKKYDMLKAYASTVESLLALSMFYKYILGNLSGVSDFYDWINKGRNCDLPIAIGSYELNKVESNKLLALTITLSKIMKKYQIEDSFFDFVETVDFLKKCMDLYYTPEHEEDNTI